MCVCVQEARKAQLENHEPEDEEEELNIDRDMPDSGNIIITCVRVMNV